jgi:hypothetical protein
MLLFNSYCYFTVIFCSEIPIVLNLSLYMQRRYEAMKIGRALIESRDGKAGGQQAFKDKSLFFLLPQMTPN